MYRSMMAPSAPAHAVTKFMDGDLWSGKAVVE